MADIKTVIRISSYETYPWLLEKHYAKRIPQVTEAFGLYEGKYLVGVCTYGKPTNPWLCNGICGEEYSALVFELNRLCLLDNIKNDASFFVAKTLKLLSKPRVVVSYADTDMGHVGIIYQACNFLYTGATAERTDVYTGEKHARHCKGLDYSKRMKRSSKHRYVTFIGTKAQKKNLQKNLRYQIYPYPKGSGNKYYAGGTVRTQLRLL